MFSNTRRYTLKLDCCAGSCSGYPTCDGVERAQLLAMRQQHIDAWAPLVRKSGNGAWAISCIDHTLTAYRWTDASWQVPARSGNTMAAAVQRWLSGEAIDLEDDVEWPHNQPCSSAD